MASRMMGRPAALATKSASSTSRRANAPPTLPRPSKPTRNGARIRERYHHRHDGRNHRALRALPPGDGGDSEGHPGRGIDAAGTLLADRTGNWAQPVVFQV